MDKLQKKIRKCKNPLMVNFSLDDAHIPPEYREQENGYLQYAKAVLTALKGTVPALRFSFGSFAAAGSEGLWILTELMKEARGQEYYTLLDVPECNSPRSAELLVENLFARWDFDGLVLGCYLGSDGVKPFADKLKDREADLFLTLRTPNRSAPQIQDLLTGTRLVYTVAADLAKRLGENYIARCGYSRIGGLGAATSAECLQMLRSKYPQMFLLVDGLDYSGANAKNCSYAFDKLGHGAVACVEAGVLSAWREEEGDGVSAALAAAQRFQKNLTRYIDIL